jgi:hypothetical protein
MDTQSAWDDLECRRSSDDDSVRSGLMTAPNTEAAIQFVKSSFGAVLTWTRHERAWRVRLSRSSSSDVRFHDYVLASLDTRFDEGEGLICTQRRRAGLVDYVGSQSAWSTPGEAARKAAATKLGVPGVCVLHVSESSAVEFVCKPDSEHLSADMDPGTAAMLRRYADDLTLGDTERFRRDTGEQVDLDYLDPALLGTWTVPLTDLSTDPLERCCSVEFLSQENPSSPSTSFAEDVPGTPPRLHRDVSLSLNSSFDEWGWNVPPAPCPTPEIQTREA